MHVKHLAVGLLLSLALLGCTPSSGPGSDSTQELPTAASPTEAVTAQTDTSTPSPTLTPTRVPLPFSKPRSANQRFLFLYTTDTEQTIYLYDHSKGDSIPAYVLPPDISLYQQEEPPVDPSIASLLEPFPKGLPSSWTRLSPDRTTLVTLQPALGGLPNYLHQIDLVTGEILSIPILVDYQWTFPTVAGRTPELGPPKPGGDFIPENASDVVQNITWAPNGRGFLFVLRTPVFELFQFDRFQIYYVARGSDRVLPLAADAPGEVVGQYPKWSPDGRYVSYFGDLHTAGIWVIELDKPDEARQLVEGYFDQFYYWSKDSRSVIYEDSFENSAGETAVGLFQVSVMDGSIQEIIQLVPMSDEKVNLSLRSETPVQPGMLIFESHRVTLDAAAQDPDYEYSPERSKYYFVSGSSIFELSLLDMAGDAILVASPADQWARVRFENNEICLILTIPGEEIIYGPDEDLCNVGTWSTDGHLLLGRNDELDFIIFDLDTMELNVVAPELDGSKVRFLGWVPDPSVYDEIVESQLP